jgi:hypothetical protein
MSTPYGSNDGVDEESPPTNGRGGGYCHDDDDIYNDDVDDDFDDVNMNGHDQLPTPEEYKAKMDEHTGGRAGSSSAAFVQFSPSNMAAELSEAGSVYEGESPHDQLPTVDEYKSSRSFAESRSAGQRAGLITFLFILLGTVIITA